MKVRARTIAITLLFIIVAVIAGYEPLLTLALIESHDIRQGVFRGFGIGMDKMAIANTVRNVGSKICIHPVPDETLVIYSKNIEELAKLRDMEGIRLSSYDARIWVNLYFADGSVSDVRGDRKSLDAKLFLTGESIKEAEATVRNLLMKDISMEARPLIGDEKNSLCITAKPESGINKYDVWRFTNNSEGPAGATYTLYFVNHALTRITYARPRVDLP